ncbi:Transcription elongation factor SPT5, partial [Nosema granulosis]
EDLEEAEDASGSVLMQSQLLPRNNSPRLFLVRVKRGAEKEIALRILANKPNICSIVAKDGLRGYLYIEAYQKQQVLDSFGKVRGINKTKISIVPQDEMIDALTYRTDFKSVEFGRIKKGKYKGDLASIVDNEGDMVTIRIVPRINGVKKLFDPEEFKGEAIRKDKNSYFYKRDLYINGFLEKEVLKNTVDFEAEPNFEELEQFHIRKIFEVDDKVRVTKGELIGLEGVVKCVRGNSVRIQTKDRSYEILSDSLDKFYSVGEEVCYNSENGIITNYANGFYFVAIKNFTEEVKVSIDKLSKPIPVTKEIVRKERPRQVFRRDGLINKQVQIRKGRFKGHTGTVKDVYMNKCRIQIDSNLTFITIPREDVTELERFEEVHREYVNEYVNSYTSIVHKTPAYDSEIIKTDTIDTPRPIETTSVYAGALIVANNDILKVEDFVGSTFFTDKGSFERNEIDFVQPAKNEDVIIMDGDYKGSKAVVIDVREDLCIVKIKNGLIKNLPMGCVCKICN